MSDLRARNPRRTPTNNLRGGKRYHRRRRATLPRLATGGGRERRTAIATIVTGATAPPASFPAAGTRVTIGASCRSLERPARGRGGGTEALRISVGVPVGARPASPFARA